MSSLASSSRESSPAPKAKETKRKRKEVQAEEERADDSSDGSDSEAEAGSDSEQEPTPTKPEEPLLSHAEKRRQKKAAKLAEKLEEEGSALKKRKMKDGSAKAVETNTPAKRQNSVWVGNMSFKTTQDNLRTFFQGVGEITRINMPTKSAPNGPGQKPENRGFAYVDFATPEAKAAAIALSENPLLGRKLLIKDGDDFAGRPAAVAGEHNIIDPAVAHKTHSKTAQKILRAQKQPPAPTLFLGNLGFETTEASIRELLDAHRPAQKKPTEADGEEQKAKDPWIRKIRMGTFEDSGLCKGFAFVDFMTVEHATSALINPKNHHLDGRKLVVEYASAEAVRRGAPKSKRTDGNSDQGRRPPRTERPRPQRNWEAPADHTSGADDAPQTVPADGNSTEVSQPPPRRKWDSRKDQPEGTEGVRHKGPKSRPKPGAALALAKRESAAIVPTQGLPIIDNDLLRSFKLTKAANPDPFTALILVHDFSSPSASAPTSQSIPLLALLYRSNSISALESHLSMTSVRKIGPDGQPTRDYKYSIEISQMMFVFGEVQDPSMETVNLVEDIVRSQLIELIVQARALATRRGARYLSAEDLIFLIRHDRGKVNRLRTYLSWKDVRKHAKDSGGEGGGGVEVETMDDGPDDKLTAKAQKITIKLPWEITTIYSEVLKQSGHQSDDEEDEDDIEAHEASIQRLKEADDATRQMTREEYQHYSDCRQASFTYRKAKRFREFLNLPPQLDLKANDDTVDIVGFLAFEMVRSLTLAGLAVKKSLEESFLRDDYTSPIMGKRKANTIGGSAEKRRRESSPDDDAEYTLPVNSLFLPPPEARTALRQEHIQDAFARMQGEWAHRRSAGMHNWHGGLVRTRISLI